MNTRPTLVILPGWGGNQQTWQNFLDKINLYLPAVCLDLPCFGVEPCPNRVWGVEDYAKFVNDKIEELGLNKVILLGHSFGGQVAVYVATHYPQHIDKLILCGSAVFRPNNTLRRIFFLIIAKFGKLIFKLPILEKTNLTLKKLMYKIARSPDYRDTSGIKREIFKKIIRQDMGHLLPKIPMPTLVIWGNRDKYVPFRQGKKIVKLVPKAKLKIIHQGDHGLHLSRPEELLDVIQKFAI